MPTLRPTIRVFISSTFVDLQAERDLLHTEVFPAVRRHCEQEGVEFLPIDLRWGISEAASLEQRTRAIIFDELQHCQSVSPYFNFISLLGDRYGSILVPESIPSTDF